MSDGPLIEVHLPYRWVALLVLVIGFYAAFYYAVRRDHFLVWTGSQVRCTDEGDRLLGNLVPHIYYVVFFPAHRLESLVRAGPLACMGWESCEAKVPHPMLFG